MSATIPQLTLFPLYPGGPKVQYKSTINANSSFYFPATQFTPQYGVNIQGNRPVGSANYSLGSGGTIRRADSTPSLFDQPIGFDGTVLGGLKKTAIPAVAPVIPNLYEQAAKLLSVSDLKMSELMAQPSFKISALGPGTGLGLEVKTDGMGGVDTVSISPSSRAMNPNLSPFDTGFGGPKRAEITAGAVFNPGFDTGLAGALPTNQAVNAQKANNNVAPNTAALVQNQVLTNVNPLAGLLQSAFDDLDFDASELNPVLQRLNQLQPADVGLPVSGFDSALTAEEARWVASNQAKLDVRPSERFRENVAGLVSASSRQGESYAAALKPVNLDGRIPMAPSLPHSGSGVGQSGAGMGQDGFNPGGGMADASDRKGNGGYLPFQMQSNAQGGFGSMANPFMAAGGFSNQSSQQQRRRLPAFVA